MWPPLAYYAWLTARRWGADELASSLAETTRAGAAASGLAEYWDPDTAAPLGAVPEFWTAIPVAMG